VTKHKIVLVPFPFDDLSTRKVRPAVCLTDPIGLHRHVIVAFITSRLLSDHLASDLHLEENEIGFGQTGLRISSTIRLHRLLTLPTSVFIRHLGSLPADTIIQMENRLRLMFGI
jgi:mRNA interferase MazF